MQPSRNDPAFFYLFFSFSFFLFFLFFFAPIVFFTLVELLTIGSSVIIGRSFCRNFVYETLSTN